jgi:hypothetical protein
MAAIGQTFDVEVDGIGAFTFRRRVMRSQFAIEAEASRVLGGPCEDEALRAGAVAFATLLVLTVESPPGWDIEGFDPLDPLTTGKIFEVARRLREVEAGFRAGPVSPGA